MKACVDKNKKSKETKQPATPHPAGVERKLSNDTKRPAAPHPNAQIDVKRLKTS